MKILMYFLYGDSRIYHLELTYSVLSAFRFLQEDDAGVRIVLAADEANLRPDLPVENVEIPADMLLEWQMDGAYNHAAKPRALRYVIERYQAPAVLLDTDTILHAHPALLFERVGQGRTLMHLREGALDRSPEWALWERLIAKCEGSIDGFHLTPQSQIYNSGVLGLHPEDIALLTDIEAVIFGLFRQEKIFTIEQMASSLVLSSKSEISISADIVEHYWDKPRTYYQYQMGNMFPGVLNGQGVESVRPGLVPLGSSPPIALRHKILARARLLLRSATPGYRSAYIAYLSAQFWRSRDPRLANMWAATTLNMLQWGVGGQSVRESDFMEFNRARLGRQAWLAPDIRARWLNYWATLHK